MNDTISNAIPLNRRQLHALGLCARHELTWGLRRVSEHGRELRDRAAEIPDPCLRAAAQCALETKRGHTDGAGLFSALARCRNPELLRALVSLEMILDYLDCVHEEAPTERNGRQLHLAIVDALDPRRPLSDWFRFAPWPGDGGYLRGLVCSTREACRALPAYDVVRPFALVEAWRCQVLPLNHIVDHGARRRALKRWAATEFAGDLGLPWFELAATGSTLMVVLPLLALAADPRATSAEAQNLVSAYWPWIPLAATVLDAYVDQQEDRAGGRYNYLRYYGDGDVAIIRAQHVVSSAARAMLPLRGGHHHAVIFACMVAMYLSKDSANVPEMRDSTRSLVEAGGSLTKLLVPVLRLWRIRYGHQAA
jgi:tetraprenyl-beta-curcumene synthase